MVELNKKKYRKSGYKLSNIITFDQIPEKLIHTYRLVDKTDGYISFRYPDYFSIKKTDTFMIINSQHCLTFRLVSRNCVNSTWTASWLQKKGLDHCQCGFECKVRVQVERNGHAPYTYIVTKKEYNKLSKEVVTWKERRKQMDDQLNFTNEEVAILLKHQSLMMVKYIYEEMDLYMNEGILSIHKWANAERLQNEFYDKFMEWLIKEETKNGK